MCPDAHERQPTLGDLLAAATLATPRGGSSSQADPAETLSAISHFAIGLLCTRYSVKPSRKKLKTLRDITEAEAKLEKKLKIEKKAHKKKIAGRPPKLNVREFVRKFTNFNLLQHELPPNARLLTIFKACAVDEAKQSEPNDLGSLAHKRWEKGIEKRTRQLRAFYYNNRSRIQNLTPLQRAVVGCVLLEIPQNSIK